MPATTSADALTVVRCQMGDQQAWAELVERWQPRLWAFIVRVSPDDSQAEDVLQTVWLRVVRSILALREPERWAPWVFGVARATIADRFRQMYRQAATEPLDEIAIDDGASQQLEAAELLEAGLDRLHPTEREVMVLHYLEELSVAEVASICGAPVGTIKSRLHRARRLLRKSLQH